MKWEDASLTKRIQESSLMSLTDETQKKVRTVYSDQGKYYIVDEEKPLKDFEVTLEDGKTWYTRSTF